MSKLTVELPHSLLVAVKKMQTMITTQLSNLLPLWLQKSLRNIVNNATTALQKLSLKECAQRARSKSRGLL